ncbi:hypothetical protein [Pseudomonas sp. R1-6]|uniref:hypothetical protein n=1 Tax=Pseudomonas sp. R1-6 TaxID=2817397 RepID=UPI003DA86C2D
MRALIFGLLSIAGLPGVTHAVDATSCPTVKEIELSLVHEPIQGRTIYDQYVAKDPSGKIIWKGEAESSDLLGKINIEPNDSTADTCVYSYPEVYTDYDSYPYTSAWRRKDLILRKQP